MARPVCQHLRTKKSYIPVHDAEDFLAEESPGAQYWCLRTLNVMGPDDILVGPNDCKSHRVCFDTVDIPFA